MAEIICDPKSGIRFGRTVISVASGRLTEQPVEALVYAANQRGLMGTGGGDTIRLAGGADIEREAMSYAPLELGAAVVTGAGKLTECGIAAVIHAVVSPQLGDPVKPDVVRRAYTEALRLADTRHLRSLALPAPAIPLANGLPDQLAGAELLIETIVTYLRRTSTRLEHLMLTVRFADEVQPVLSVVARARERSWNPPAWLR